MPRRPYGKPFKRGVQVNRSLVFAHPLKGGRKVPAAHCEISGQKYRIEIAADDELVQSILGRQVSLWVVPFDPSGK